CTGRPPAPSDGFSAESALYIATAGLFPAVGIDRANRGSCLRSRNNGTLTTVKSNSLAAGAFALLVLYAACPAFAERLPLERIKLPPGFEISVFADGVRDARSLALGRNNVLFVGTRADRVYAVRYRD